MQTGDDKLSTTALARKLSIPVQQLFSILKDYDWIQRIDDSWVLTPKGEFEGGPGCIADNVICDVKVSGNADEQAILDLILHTDTVAEMNNTLRAATPVSLGVI